MIDNLPIEKLHLAGALKAARIAAIQVPTETLPQSPMLSAKDLLLKITGIDLSRCPYCHEGTMITVGDLVPWSRLPRWDSS